MNIIVIDWSVVWRSNAANFVIESGPKIGVFMGDFIEILVKNYHLNLAKTVLVGHAFGGMFIGMTGRALKGQVNSLVALDPFPGTLKTDGNFVQVTI